MGTDIHAYIEFTNPEEQIEGEEEEVECLAKVELPRSYELFTAMADVRPDVVAERGETIKPFQPKGIPLIISWMAEEEYIEEDGAICPDWHTPSWLSTDELKIAYKESQCQLAEVEAVIAAMEALDRHRFSARLTFWFDN